MKNAVMEYGYRIIDDLISGLSNFMAQKGCKSVSELIGVGIDKLVPTDEIERDTIIYPHFRRKKCIGCGRCYISCMDGGHQALKFDEEKRRPTLIPRNCVGCHLCALVCPNGAITGDGKRISPKK